MPTSPPCPGPSTLPLSLPTAGPLTGAPIAAAPGQGQGQGQGQGPGQDPSVPQFSPSGAFLAAGAVGGVNKVGVGETGPTQLCNFHVRPLSPHPFFLTADLFS